MFVPQSTPNSSFSSYGAVPGFRSFPSSATSRSALVVNSGGPTTFRDPVFNPVNINGNARANPGASNYNNMDPQFKMANGINDLEQQEELARNFQPDLQGPLVGEKRSSHAITEEYAKADPIYVAKTAALPQKYSHYRPILGDGNCGWRAVGFTYFETLLRTQDRTQLEGEVARMTSLNNLLVNIGGFQAWLFEDMVEETTTLLKDLAGMVETSPQSAADLLLQRFNNREISDSIVYHLRLLASSWLKNCSAQYEAFIPVDTGGVEGYRKEWLEPTNQEIDHLGMQLLVDVLLKQIGFAVEVVYLDRSEGSQVNSHLMQAEDANGVPTNPAGPIIHLLYRPSHYDILYKDLAPSIPLQQAIDDATQNPVHVNRATSFSQQHTIQSTNMNEFPSGLDLSSLLGIPGFQCSPPSHQGFPAQFQSPIEQSYSPISASMSSMSPEASTPTSTNTNLSLSTNFPPQQAAGLASPPLSTPQSSHSSFQPQTMQLPIYPSVPKSKISPHPLRPALPAHSSLSSQHSDLPSPTSASSPFRPSRYEWDARMAEHDGPVVFHTSTFKNSHYNTAHYNNPNFHPEEWSPEWEEAGSGQVGGVARKRPS